MKTQNYKNHGTLNYLSRTSIFYYVLGALLLLLCSWYFVSSLWLKQDRVVALLLFLFSLLHLISYFLFRSFALKAQDRAIRSEENLRLFVMTGKLLPKALKLGQIIALRFASDEEYLNLIHRALEENLTPDQIKKSIVNWRADYHRA